MENLEKQLDIALELRAKLRPKLARILLPGLEALGLNYFWYNRFINGRYYLSIGTHDILKDFYFKINSWDLFFGTEEVLMRKQSIVIWEQQPIKQVMNSAGVENGVSVFRRRKNFVEAWHLGSTVPKLDLGDLYLNNIESAFRLITFFQEVALPLIPIRDSSHLTPYMDGFELKIPTLDSESSRVRLTQLIDATPLKKFTLHHNGQDVRLSLRELQSLHFLSQGKSTKEIASKLGLSHRTIEHYIDGIRNKVNCSEKSDLIEIYQANDISLWFHG